MGYSTPLLLLTKAVFVLLCCLSDVQGITEYCVKPTEFDYISCPGEPCHTLNYFASNTHNTWSDVVLRFLPGNHSLNRSLYISNNSNLYLTTFHPVTSIQNLSVSIHCPSIANFHCYNVSNITIDGLSFHNCGIPEKYLFDTSAEGTNVTNFWVDYIKIQSWRTTDGIRVKKGCGRSVNSHSESLDLDCPYPCIGLVSIVSGYN